ncbi:MAG: sulfurtransferase TusA family protein [Pseudomonadales bacterium]
MSEHIVDAVGLACPLPLLKAKQALSLLQPGQRLKVLATDAGSVRDFRSWTDLTAHTLVESTQQERVFIYIIEKG